MSVANESVCYLLWAFTEVILVLQCLVCSGSLPGVRNDADAKLVSEKQRQVADLQNQLKSLVSWCCTFVAVVTVWRRRRRFWHATLRLHSAVRRHHPPQRAVLSQICCFEECKVVLFQILLDGAEPRDEGTTWLSSPFCWRGTNRILLASALSSMRIICPNRVSRHDWIIAVSLGLGCFINLRTSSFQTNWCHLMPSSISRHHWSSASIFKWCKEKNTFNTAFKVVR